MKNNDRIVFFSSGDFGIDTLKTLLINGANIVGVVTSNDTVKYHKERIEDIAKENGIPTYVVRQNNLEKEDWLFSFLERAKADIFCVISFKKLPLSITKLAKKCAFNVHASLLPCLRGSAPIEWAIATGMKETGLTAFVLDEKIDCGDILANEKIKIGKNETYTSLFKKLMLRCVDFVHKVIEDILANNNYKNYLISQPDMKILPFASKIDKQYFSNMWNHFAMQDAQSFVNIINSVNDRGFNCKIFVNGETKDKEFECKIWSAEVGEVISSKDLKENRYNEIFTDNKTYLKIAFDEDQPCVNITKIQIAGKKAMDIADFLNGFRYFDMSEYITYFGAVNSF